MSKKKNSKKLEKSEKEEEDELNEIRREIQEAMVNKDEIEASTKELVN